MLVPASVVGRLFCSIQDSIWRQPKTAQQTEIMRHNTIIHEQIVKATLFTFWKKIRQGNISMKQIATAPNTWLAVKEE